MYAGCLSPDCEGAVQLAENDRIRVLKMNVSIQEDLDDAFKLVKEDLKSNGWLN